MHKRNIPPYHGCCNSKLNEMRVDRQPPHIMKYCDRDRSIDLYLCCFCNNLPDLSLKTACKHFQLVCGTECPYFSKVSDTVQRINQLIDAKEENQCDSGQI